ncbi:uncharacterized protein LOC126318279 [Schistocerca gregaria]|uniref:uncharacterized protein LOC126318279 n=1 Tax=Schistocerca gregaria TaxID=7010 RepID=UPI00211F2410|nr:uncharacterized protein LOC126318279 [Schistocerca gregaria]
MSGNLSCQTEPLPRWFWQDKTDYRWKEYDSCDSDTLELISRTGGTTCEVTDKKYVCDLDQRVQYDPRNTEEKCPILRGTWFWKGTQGDWQPYPESTAEKLESAFYHALFGVELKDLGLDPYYIVLDDEVKGIGRQYDSREPRSNYKKVMRGYNGGVIQLKSDSGSKRAAVQGGEGDQLAKIELPARSRVGIWKEGPMSKKSGVIGWKMRWLALTDDFLGIYANRMKEKQRLFLSKMVFVDISPDQRATEYHYWVIRMTDAHYTFRTGSKTEAQEWISVINYLRSDKSARARESKEVRMISNTSKYDILPRRRAESGAQSGRDESVVLDGRGDQQKGKSVRGYPDEEKYRDEAEVSPACTSRPSQSVLDSDRGNFQDQQVVPLKQQSFAPESLASDIQRVSLDPQRPVASKQSQRDSLVYYQHQQPFPGGSQTADRSVASGQHVVSRQSYQQRSNLAGQLSFYPPSSGGVLASSASGDLYSWQNSGYLAGSYQYGPSSYYQPGVLRTATAPNPSSHSSQAQHYQGGLYTAFPSQPAGAVTQLQNSTHSSQYDRGAWVGYGGGAYSGASGSTSYNGGYPTATASPGLGPGQMNPNSSVDGRYGGNRSSATNSRGDYTSNPGSAAQYANASDPRAGYVCNPANTAPYSSMGNYASGLTNAAPYSNTGGSRANFASNNSMGAAQHSNTGNYATQPTNAAPHSSASDSAANCVSNNSTNAAQYSNTGSYTSHPTSAAPYSSASDSRASYAGNNPTNAAQYSSASDSRASYAGNNPTNAAQYSSVSDLRANYASNNPTNAAQYSSASDLRANYASNNPTNTAHYSNAGDSRANYESNNATNAAQYSSNYAGRPTNAVQYSNAGDSRAEYASGPASAARYPNTGGRTSHPTNATQYSSANDFRADSYANNPASAAQYSNAVGSTGHPTNTAQYSSDPRANYASNNPTNAAQYLNMSGPRSTNNYSMNAQYMGNP